MGVLSQRVVQLGSQATKRVQGLPTGPDERVFQTVDLVSQVLLVWVGESALLNNFALLL
jgi:hypothetical protein